MIDIFYQRAESEKLLALRYLFRRLSITHPKYITVKHDLYNAEAGHAGEQFVDSIIKSIHFPLPYAVFPNLRLYEHGIPSTQIDILLITQSYALVLEVKNWAGDVTFQSIGQVHQKKPDVAKTMDCPTVQVETNRCHFMDWLTKHNVQLPVHKAVIFPHVTTVIHGAENREVLFSKELPLLIRKLNNLPIQITHNSFQNLCMKISQADKPYTENHFCKTYDLTDKDLLKGLFCEKCGQLLNKQSHRIYVCKLCMYIPDNPYKESMTAWFTLFKPLVQNKEIMNFTGSLSPRTVSYFMKISGFPYSGDRKARRYHLNKIAKHKYESNLKC